MRSGIASGSTIATYASLAPSDVDVVASGLAGYAPLDGPESAALVAVFGGATRVASPKERLGETFEGEVATDFRSLYFNGTWIVTWQAWLGWILKSAAEVAIPTWQNTLDLSSCDGMRP